jgi:signal transduction histidine kinase
MVALEVEDCGPGIPVEHRDRVFDRFYRIDEGRSREAGGAGLGLAIARWGAEAHGGRLELRDAPETGSVFRVVLPTSLKPPDAENMLPVVPPGMDREQLSLSAERARYASKR